MASLIQELINTLDKELEIYHQLLTISEEKTDVIVKNDVPSLQNLTTQEQILTGQVFRLEKSREILIEDISIVLNHSKKDLTLIKLIQLIGDEIKEKDQLLEHYRELNTVLGKLKECNEHNRMLINQAVDFVDFTINTLKSTKIGPQTSGYSNRGNEAIKPLHQSFFDAKQ